GVPALCRATGVPAWFGPGERHAERRLPRPVPDHAGLHHLGLRAGADAFGEDGRHHLRGPRPGRPHVVAYPRPGTPVADHRRRRTLPGRCRGLPVPVRREGYAGCAGRGRRRKPASLTAPRRSGLGLAGADGLLYAVAEGLVHVAPVLEGALQDGLGHALEQVAGDVADEAFTGRVVENLADHGAGLAPVVVIRAQGVSRTHQVAVGVPVVRPVVLAVGLRAALGVRRVHRVGRVDDPHRAVLAVAVHGDLGRVHRDLLVVDAHPGPVRVGVGEPAGQQHLVRAERDAGDQVVRLERGLLHLGVVVAHVAVQGQPADLDQ